MDRRVSHKASTWSVARRGRKKDHIEQFLGSPQILLQPALSQLRYMVLVDGLGEFPDMAIHPYRIYVWSILLRVGPTASQEYVDLVSMGKSLSYNKIINDTFRTLTTDKKFQARISEDSLIRVLNAYSWKVKDNTVLSPYVQGMNVLLSPILYSCKSEPQLFAVFHKLLTVGIPTYVTPTLTGVHTGLQLLDVCLEIIDNKLFKFLNSKYLKSEIYAFASVLTLSSCTPPLEETMKLWDFMFCYGCHMNILFVIAQLILIRNKLMESEKPMTLLRSFPPLNANEIIKLSVSFLTKLPDPLYDLLIKHTYQDIQKELKEFKTSSI